MESINRNRGKGRFKPLLNGDRIEKKAGKLRDRFMGSHYTTKLPYFFWLSKMNWKIILCSFCAWGILINYYERIVVKRAMERCQWSRWEQWPDNAQSHKVGLFADPQIMDGYSYPGRSSVINYFTRVIIDHYHIRNWKYVQYYLNPDTNIFLGDLFDGGRNWDDDVWMEEYKRFRSIFPKKPNKKTITSLPGNHDIGFGETVIEPSFKRFSTFFGDTSSIHNVGNHSFVLLDTIALSATNNDNVSSIPRQFLTDYSKMEHPYPRILLTHVPLWRDVSKQTCGSKRESDKLFPVQKGLQYQTVIDQAISQDILTQIAPKYVFSGDDHDYCHIKHHYFVEGRTEFADEITVKSCAMNMGISRPAIQLLSLHNDVSLPSQDSTIQTEICYLPDPFKPLWMYISFALLNLFLVSIVVCKKMDKNKVASLPLPVEMEKSHSRTGFFKGNVRQKMHLIFLHVLAVVPMVLVIFYYYFVIL
ncbi:putative lipid phosphatase CDC1 KNAG_0A04740 [Huiozyma naganishii CBS 8797]|uniref:Calcineurin-like phosphoesterase domain-containing protein n=1 Tax=Huiozyma naganishii (strain ATCC MYA-139 / BCRC 22969 / CBS 8797 / KCTC 17520 / NBRC 10181 / NCYC 3082 / Yp74L-3) TaxID=1071383 RepID=J7R021_HUIN7|nr:hypothetical protein KNAG_0A04740 [Kazachstania naganishii CBS 8797]CCK68145.1 hypothetical protein KNAG_0A04740 [Kazachstania naganishii CBS 8797]